MPFIVTPGQLNRRAELYHQLGTMLTAGIPLLKGLEMVSVRPVVRGSRPAIYTLIEGMRSGLTFTESMSMTKGWFSDFDMALLAAGEKTGRLDSSFKLLAEYYTTRARIIRDSISGLLLTMVTLHVFLLLIPLSLWTQFATGLINGDYAQCIPFLIQKVAIFGTIYGVIFLGIYAVQEKHGEHWRGMIESFTQMIPLFSKAQRYLALSRLSASLEALISAGVSIIDGWQLAAAASGSPRLREIVARWKPQLEMGTTPAELVNQTPYFPEMFANFYVTGEESGKLDDSLSRMQVYYQDEGFRALKLFTQVLNGTIYGAVALFVAIYVIRFWMQYFSNIFNNL